MALVVQVLDCLRFRSGKCGLRDNRPTVPNILKKVSGMAASESKLFAHASKVVYIVSQYLWTKLEDVVGRWVLFKGLFARREDYPRIHTLPLLMFSSCLQGSQGYPGRRVTLSAC